MENNGYEKFLVCIKQKLPRQQLYVECDTKLESEEEISRVLGVNASSYLTQIECTNGEVSVSGVVTINILYATITEQIGSDDYSTTFNSKIQNTQVTPDCKILLDTKVEEVIVDDITNQTAKIRCGILIDGILNKNQEIQHIHVEQQDICVKTTETTAMYIADYKNSTWSENQQLVIKQPIQKLLTSTNQVVCKNWEVAHNVLTIEGQIFNKIIYLSDEDTQKLMTIYNTFDFKQDIEFDNLSNDAMACVNISIVSQDAKCIIDEKNNQTTLELEIPIQSNICIYENKTIYNVCDLFSTTHNLFPTSLGYNNCITRKPEYFEKKIETSVSLTENEPRIDKLLAVTYTHIQTIANYIKEEHIVIEAIAKANLVYLNDEESKIFSVDIEFPVVVNNNTELEEDVQLDVFATLCDVDIMVKRGRDIYVDAVVKAFVNVYECQSGAVISEISQGDPLELNNAGIEIYFAKQGDDVWDIAKQLKIKPEIIEKQNQEICFPLEKDENISIYYN